MAFAAHDSGVSSDSAPSDSASRALPGKERRQPGRAGWPTSGKGDGAGAARDGRYYTDEPDGLGIGAGVRRAACRHHVERGEHSLAEWRNRKSIILLDAGVRRWYRGDSCLTYVLRGGRSGAVGPPRPT